MIAFSSVGLYSDNLIIKGVSLAVSAVAMGLEAKEIFNDAGGWEREQTAVDTTNTPEVTMPEQEAPSSDRKTSSGDTSSKTVGEDNSNDKLAESSEAQKKRKRIRGSAKKKEELKYEEPVVVHSMPVPQKAPAKQPKKSSSSSSYEFIPSMSVQNPPPPEPAQQIPDASWPISFSVPTGAFGLEKEVNDNLLGVRGDDHKVDLKHLNEAVGIAFKRKGVVKNLHPKMGKPIDFKLANQPNKLLRIVLMKHDDGKKAVRSCYYITTSSLKRELGLSGPQFEHYLEHELRTLTGQNVTDYIVPTYA